MPAASQSRRHFYLVLPIAIILSWQISQHYAIFAFHYLIALNAIIMFLSIG
jgi:hypothetical protein